MDPDSKRRAGRGLRVAVTDRLGRPLHAPGLAAWLCRVAPLSARGAVAVALVTDARIRTLNERFRHVATATDVLSFPSSDSGEARLATSTPGPETRVLGDIVISTDTARRQARDAGHSYAVELKILALHGLLHLLGYDHDARSDRGRMARLERRLRAKGGLRAGLIERARAPKGQREGAQQSEPRDRSEPAPFDAAQGAVSARRTAKRRARARAGESKRRRPSGKR